MNKEAQLKKAIATLQEKGGRVTKPRLRLLSLLVKEHGPFTIEEIKAKVRGCDLVTVYRFLSTLENFGLVHRCDFGDGTRRYEWQDPDHHHHHVICTDCGEVSELSDCLMEKAEANLTKLGYRNIRHSLEVFALCPRCA